MHASGAGWRRSRRTTSTPDPQPATPDPSSDPDDLDEIAIERAITGDTRVRLTYAEQLEAVRRMSDRGYSIRTIA